MYVALQELVEQKADGRYARVFPGQTVESFKNWPLQNQLAALATQRVREAPAREEDFGFTLQGASSPDAIREAQDRATAAALGAAASATEPAPAPASAAPIAVGMPNAEPAAVAATDTDFVCSKCDFVAKAARGLAIHMGREHKNA